MQRKLLWVGAVACASLSGDPDVASADGGHHGHHGNRGHEILTIDHDLDHVSTVPAIAGEEVTMFLRERVAEHRLQDGSTKGAVLFVHGGSVPSVPAMDFAYKDYSWAEYLARSGFDVFLLDVNGYGLSPRPLMDNPCNTTNGDQIDHLMPNPLDATCAPEYPFRLNTIASERDEIDSAVDYIRDLRGFDKVSLIGWSGGGQRTGSYTALHSDKVEKLIILASSGYSRNGSSDPPAQVPAPGTPMRIQSYDDLIFGRWFPNVACDQVDEGVEDVVWAEIMAVDEVGSTWGTPAYDPDDAPEGGLMRVPQRTNWGWNQAAAGSVSVPTLILVGEQDGLYNSMNLLFEDLGTDNKVFLGMECASHFVTWEHQHTVLQQASAAWLRNSAIEGVTNGHLTAQADGKIRR